MTKRSLRWRLHQILESGLGHDALAVAVNLAIIAVMIANEIAVLAGSAPSVRDEHGGLLHAILALAAVVFLAEYVCRLWAAVELPFLSRTSHWQARRAYALTALSLVDLVSAATAVAALVWPHVAALHVLRLIAILKVARYSSGLQSLGHVIAEERSALFAALLVIVCLLLFAASGMWLIEGNLRPNHFATLPDTLWWAIVTLATVGYGDVVPITPLGKVFTGCIIMLGIAVFALPVGIVVTGFTQMVARRDFMVTWALVARVPVFAGLDAAAIAEIMDLLHSHTYEAGEEVVREGEPADAMYFIAQGDVTVAIDDRCLKLGIGEFFGEMAMLEGRAHRHDVTAMTRCRLLVLRREDFNRLGRLYPEMLARVQKTAAERRAAP
ncbi:MAG: ion transporter [Proteobacteria bacterium]|nr:ion transporter [Pseudomonadota bacterium]